MRKRRKYVRLWKRQRGASWLVPLGDAELASLRAIEADATVSVAG